jgi:glycosyltransferase involved in cell wall biosynthesis
MIQSRPPPRAALTLFAYNQEGYIAEAVTSVLQQEGEPLHIILSDDASSDRTYEIMQDIVQAYRGPHHVDLRRNSRNLGLIDHYNLIFCSIEEPIIILAAGDDVSLPHRAATCLAAFDADDGAMLFHSSVIKVDENGTEQGTWHPPRKGDRSELLAITQGTSIYIGASGAFRTSLFKTYGKIRHRDTYEDVVLGFRAALLDGLRFHAEPLVRYRINIGLSFKLMSRTVPRRKRRLSSIRWVLATYNQRLDDLDLFHHPRKQELAQALQLHRDLAQARLDLLTSPSQFVRLLLRGKLYAGIKAISAEVKYKLGLID